MLQLLGFLDLFLDLDKFIAKMLDVVNRCMLIRFVFSAHRLGFLMLLRFVALDWVLLDLFLNATQIGVLNVICPNGRVTID